MKAIQNLINLNQKKINVLVCGQPRSGKSTILHKLSSGESTPLEQPLGFNSVQFEYKNIKINMTEKS